MLRDARAKEQRVNERGLSTEVSCYDQLSSCSRRKGVSLLMSFGAQA
jgi:hypothetical protein